MFERAREILNLFECDIGPDKLVGDLPIAQQQMIEICARTTFGAKVVILDEPTASLSSRETELLYHNIERLRSRGCSIIYISHRMDEIFRLTDRITVLRDGRHRATYQTQETDIDQVTEAMIGRQIENYFSKRKEHAGKVVLDVKNLTVPGHAHDVSLNVREGEIVGLYGLVGAGRSETVEALFGIRHASSGTVLIDGRKITIKTPRDAMRNGIARYQKIRKVQGLVLSLGAKANMTLPMLSQYTRGGFLSNGKEAAVYENFREQLRIAAANQDQPVQLLSGGNQQKIVLAKWLNASPRVLILDEPARGVDIGAKAEIYRLIKDLADKGTAILVISSEMPEVIGLSDRVLTMYQGRISGTFEGDRINEGNLVRGATGGII